MKIYNTLTKQKEEFIPRNDKKVQMFVCGPTVYDYIHIGNARTFVFFDVVAKYLSYKGYDVAYIQNITDIDNKIIEKAQKEGVDSLEYAKKYSDIFKEDMQALGVTAPEYKNATDHIPEVIKQVQILMDKGNAYLIENDGIYFDLSTFPDYGKLSGRTAGMADDAVSRIDDSDKKRNRGDFALWKFSTPGDPTEILGGLKHRQETIPSWPAPFGAGRPGWHIEDTAITDKYFGPQYDIHGGGQDLIFPHHEAEIAQQCAAAIIRPREFVKYWMHVGFLVNKESKMSKSLGNFTTLREALKKYSPETLRFYFLSAHYRSPLNFSEEILEQTINGSNRIKEVVQKLQTISNSNIKIDRDDLRYPITYTSGDLDYFITYDFMKGLDDDFNTSIALGSLGFFISSLNSKIDSQDLSSSEANKYLKLLERVDEILGIIPELEKIPQNILTLVSERENARQNKDYTTGDSLREKINQLGYQIDDTPYGPLIKKR